MRVDTPKSYREVWHYMVLFGALWATEQWTQTVERGGKLGLYARARQVVMFDRILNEGVWSVEGRNAKATGEKA